MEASACRLGQSTVGVPLHPTVESFVSVMGGSVGEYALAATVYPNRRRGVSSFLIHLRLDLSAVVQSYLVSFLVGNVV